MDHSGVQQILDHANTRGTAIVMRTIKEMVRDKKTILVALVSLIPIIGGIWWSHFLSDDEDIEEIYIEPVPDTAEIFCYVDIPNYLPDIGNYTFEGSILNNGDTDQEISVNFTLANSKTQTSGIRKTTGLMLVKPYVMAHYPDPPNDPHYFNITFDMSQFRTGTSFIVIELYVNNSVSSSYLIPEDFDLTQVDFSQFEISDIVGSTDAVFSDDIHISDFNTNYIGLEPLSISLRSDIMPFTLSYPTHMTPEIENSLNCTIRAPLNGSTIYVELDGGSFEVAHAYEFTEEMDEYNFILQLEEGFSEVGFDHEFEVRYSMELRNLTTYQREGVFHMDLVKSEYMDSPQVYTLELSNNTMYEGQLRFPTAYLTDIPNVMNIDLVNNDLYEREVKVNIRFGYESQEDEIQLSHNFSKSYTLEGNEELSTKLIIPFLLSDIWGDQISSSAYVITMNFSIEVDGILSKQTRQGSTWATTFYQRVRGRTETLSDTYTPSLRAFLEVPEDITTTEDTYVFRGTINNTGIVDKEYHVVLTLQGYEFRSKNFTLLKGDEHDFTISVPMKELSKKFNSDFKVEVFSSLTLLAEDAEAEASGSVNVIEESHKERMVLENFLWVYVQLYMKFIVPLVAMVYGISLISQESDKKTLALYRTTPITNMELILYKFGGFLVALTVILSIPLIFIYLSFAYILPLRLIVYYLLLLGVCEFDMFLAIAGYGAIFTMIGTIEKRPVFIGLSYLMVWEMFLGSLNFFLTRYTLFYHIRCAVLPFVERYVPDALDVMALRDLSDNDFSIAMEISMGVLIFVVFVFLFIGIKILGSRDIN